MMNQMSTDEEQSDLLGEGLVYEDQIPLSWNEVEAQILPVQLMQIHESNEECLRYLAILEGSHKDFSDDPQAANVTDILRLEYKLNLLLDMVSKILVHHVEIPQSVTIRLSSRAIQWQSAQAPDLGKHIHLELFLNKKIPRPIVLPGVVQLVEQCEGGYKTTMILENFSGAVMRWLEKLIFRQHRRSVAFERQHSQDQDQA